MKSSDILVIIVAYNSIRWVQKCYDSLKSSTMKCDVLTIDNGSQDGTQQLIAEKYPFVELIQNQSNVGFGRANNIGLQKALDEGYDYVYLLNQDAWVFPDTIERLVHVSRNNSEYGILSPMQMMSDAQHLDYRFGTYVINSQPENSKLLIEDLYYSRCSEVYDVTFVMAAHWLVTRKCFSLVGGFSPSFHQYGEDNNYIHRALFKHFKVGIVPNSKAVHDRSNSEWSNDKISYICNYVMPVVSLSNPMQKETLSRILSNKVFEAINNRDRKALKMVFRIWKERKVIKENYLLSLGSQAFLRHE